MTDIQQTRCLSSIWCVCKQQGSRESVHLPWIGLPDISVIYFVTTAAIQFLGLCILSSTTTIGLVDLCILSSKLLQADLLACVFSLL